MPKLSSINFDTSRFKGKGLRPWVSNNVTLSENTNKEKNSKALKNDSLNVSNTLSTDNQYVSESLAYTLANKNETISEELGDSAKSVSNALSISNQYVSESLAYTLAENNITVSEQLPDNIKNVIKPLSESTQYVSESLAYTLAEKNETVSEPLSKQNLTISKLTNLNQKKSVINNHITIDNLHYLIGKERALLDFIFDNCHQNGTLISPPLTTEILIEVLSVNANRLRNIIKRLTDKKIILVKNQKFGCASWRQFELSQKLFQEMILLRRKQQTSLSLTSVNREQTVINTLANQEPTISNRLAEPLAKTLAHAPSSSSYINNTTTTDSFNLNDDWLLIDIAPLAEIGFSDAQLKQLAKAQKLTAEQVQESIYAFAYARSKPEIVNSIRTSHLAYFMGILIKRGEPYLPPYGYESPKEIALKAELERKKRQLALEEELSEIKFIEWYSSLNTELKAELTREQASDEDYKLYFESKQMPEHVKESKRKSILKPYYINIICNKEV